MKYLLIISLLLGLQVHAQKVRAYWEDDSILVGSPAVLQIVIENSPEQVKWTKLKSSSNIQIRQSSEQLYQAKGEIEVLSTPKKYNRKERKTVITCTMLAWDTANYKLPDQILDIYDRSWKKKDTSLVVAVPELSVYFRKKVVDLSISEEKFEEIADPWEWLKRYWYTILALVLLLIALIVWNKRKKTTLYNKETLKSEALKHLRELESKKYWEKEQTERHYIVFAKILKEFLTVRYGVNFKGITTYNTEHALRKLELEEHVVRRVKNLLLASDFTKFGKTEPTAENIILNLRQLEELIIELSPLDIPK